MTNRAYVWVLSGLLLAGAATTIHAQGRVNTPPEIKKPAERKVITAPSGRASRQVVSVPNVVGLFVKDAQQALYQAGLKWKITYLAEADSSVRRGHVLAAIPGPGTVVPGLTEVELQIPGAANQIGKGNLGLADIERRMGFDLDTGRFEEMCSGADFLLLKFDQWHEPPPSNPQSSRYWTSNLMISATGAARLAPLDLPNTAGGGNALGSYLVYDACENKLGPSSRDITRLASVFDMTQPRMEKVATFCVRTSKGQIAAVSFSSADNAAGIGASVTEYSYIFRWALFEHESPLRPSERTTTRKP